MNTTPQIVLALYPNTRGIGYVCIEYPQKILDSGVATVRPILNSQLVKRIEKFIDFYKPVLIVIRNCDLSQSGNVKRAKQLVDDIITHAKEKQIPTYHYSREQVKDVFEQFGVQTKYEISQKIIEWFPELKWRSPKIRKTWMDEDYHMGVFDAFSLAIAHRYLSE